MIRQKCHHTGINAVWGFRVMAKERAAFYLRVSTADQDVENQRRELREAAESRGWVIVAEFVDAGISGSRGRDKRPGLDAMLRASFARKFDVAMVWAVDRLGRSTLDLLGIMQHLKENNTGRFLLRQQLDTTTPAGAMMFQVLVGIGGFEI